MKKIVFILIAIISFSSCKNDAKQNINLEENRAKSYDANDGFITMKGDFVYDANKNAAVFQTGNDIYGVIVDDNMKALNEKVKPFKEDEYTSVPITVRVKRIKNSNKASLWTYNIEIKEILKVEAPDPNKDDVIKLAN
ncbi:hypothetical protein [Winogradskyella sp. KYW1333]|uniref:hypothetical protein n=1 Tax=Winogradskyella sp. KYW1333 TaxID=2282123 RepID=UPI000DF45427|nr:hypothetical protein [Winogradskyella sp. KYW1333]RCT53535.1 hypothetical protein DUZ96_09950 [Winogradskyella sp. KYW1333]